MKKLLFVIMLLLSSQSIFAQIDADELAKWEGRKYSMFIHWGIYSDLGGVWQGKNISVGLSEQIQAHAGIYSDTYAEIAKTFNPVKWNAEEVVLLAKKAGMRSIVISSKHHDGFCMFKTETTKFNIVDATPYGRDVLKELSEACAKHGIKFGLYYSLIDWNYPQASPISSHNSDYITPEHFEFNKAQIKELLTNYGEISELWFDMGSHSFEQSVEMKEWVRRFQPNCMVGGRIGNSMGDFMVMADNQEPNYIIGVPWQSPASFFHETWGYRSWQKQVPKEEKLKEKLTSLINVSARGGNYLLNIGPRGDGSVVDYESEILVEIGKWLEKNGEAIYNTQSDPFRKAFDWGAVTSTSNAIYLHILNMQKNREIVIPNLRGDISTAEILGERSKLKHKRDKETITISLPKNLDDETVNVVKLSFKNSYFAFPSNVYDLTTGLKLNQYNAFDYYSHSGVDYNSIYQSTIKNSWTMEAISNTKARPVLTYTDQEIGKEISLNIANKVFDITLDGEAEISHKLLEDFRFGSIYTQPMRRSSLIGFHDDVSKIDIEKEWGAVAWTLSEYKNNETYSLAGGLRYGYYLVQEIESDKEQTVIIGINTQADGVVAMLNGIGLVNHGNLKKETEQRDILALNLKEGKNLLFVKLFANFRDQISFSINTDIAQRFYTKKLGELSFEKGAYIPVSLKLRNQITIHETMNIPNLNLSFELEN